MPPNFHTRFIRHGVAVPLLFLSFSLSFLSLSQAKELTGVYEPAAGPCPTVEEAIAKMTAPDGYAVRCFASEPMIVNPVAMTWDHRGRLWVVELYEYPMGAKTPNDYSKAATDEKFRPVIPAGPDAPRDRVVVLEDTDNDGVADKRTVFVEGLNLATGILCGHGGVFVGQAPNLFFFRDTDGDDKADEYKTVLTGFGLEDRHELLNSFAWGPDGWMYFTHGVFTHSNIRRPGEPASKGTILNAGIYRVRFQGGEAGPEAVFHEVYADGTSNPWGVDFDARGNAFVEACVIDHLFHMAPGGLYARQGGAPENPYAYELLPSIVPKDHPRHFRAAYAGIQIYQGGVYPEDTRGHVFFGNIHDNAIHEEALEPAGATFKAKVVRDFLRANNGWFRPVSVQTGPDGFLWVMDWCDKYPCYQNALANPEGVDREKGRIWRVVYHKDGVAKDAVFPSRAEKDLDFGKLKPEELVERLSHPNNWIARQALQQLKERSGAADRLQLSTPLLNALAGAGEEAAGRLLSALSFLDDGSDRSPFNGELLGRLTREGKVSPQWAARLIGQQTKPLDRHSPEIALLNELAGHESPVVRAEVAVALRRHLTGTLTQTARSVDADREETVAAVLQTLLRASLGESDRSLAFAIWSALEPLIAKDPKYLELITRGDGADHPLAWTLTYKAARRITDTRNAESMDALLAFLERIKASDTLTARALDGMLKAQEAGALKPAKTDPDSLFKHWGASKDSTVRELAGRLATLWGDPNAVGALMGVVLDETADTGKRAEAIRTVRRLKSDAARAGIQKLLESKAPDALMVEALRAAAELGGHDLANTILKAWNGYSPALRAAAAEVMVSRADWAARLLDGVEGKWIASGKISASDIPVTARRTLATQGNEELKARAAALLGAWNDSTEDVKALIAAKKKICAEGEPDLENGRKIFEATCAVCHVFYGGGQEVGPDLIGSGRSNLDALLANVIDPNQIIGNGYQNFIVTTHDGRVLTGRVIEDTPTQVTLLGIGGRREVVPVADIKERIDTGMSAMPMGFDGLPDKDFRDLMWFILAPPEEGGLTPEKKEALSRGVDGLPETPAAPENRVGPDRESASLWNPEWMLDAPDFEGTPTKVPDYHGRKNVLMLHPYSETKPAALARTLELPADKAMKLTAEVASHDRGTWRLAATVDGKALEGTPDAPEGRWLTKTWDLSAFKGRKVEIRLLSQATGWSFEFSYWGAVKLEPAE